MSDNFHRAHAFTAHWEGGFSDHPADTGGLTAYGASLKFVQGIAATQQGRDWLQRIGFRLPVNKASMRSVTPDMAEAMFKREFWDRLRLDDMPFRPACALYDAAVNSGCAQSVKLAQRGYNACVGPYGVKIEVRRQDMPTNLFTGKIRISEGIDHALWVLQQSADFQYTRNELKDMIYIH